jgi:hypothetical protein
MLTKSSVYYATLWRLYLLLTLILQPITLWWFIMNIILSLSFWEVVIRVFFNTCLMSVSSCIDELVFKIVVDILFTLFTPIRWLQLFFIIRYLVETWRNKDLFVLLLLQNYASVLVGSPICSRLRVSTFDYET